MRKYIIYFPMVLVVVSLGLMFADWVQHPELTQMQIFIRGFRLWLIGIVSGLLSIFIIERGEGDV